MRTFFPCAELHISALDERRLYQLFDHLRLYQRVVYTQRLHDGEEIQQLIVLEPLQHKVCKSQHEHGGHFSAKSTLNLLRRTGSAVQAVHTG